MILLFDCFIFLYLVQYVFIDAMLTPIFGGGATVFLDRIFGSIFGGLAGKEGCGADIIFHYQWGYFFYITTVGSFFLSTILGLVTFLRNRKG
ncbi:hypothetical protein BJF95_08095 [Rhizobium oryziradicis]|uniref:Uncharacterized protein n=2 Tax=Rhizobium oryziradicis TaxID=1867956 RepID=A0A1Q8ZRB6_9HYPH|nr:hypothetical protein BJF95_08095 [Rhizobium oryziradicis]